MSSRVGPRRVPRLALAAWVLAAAALLALTVAVVRYLGTAANTGHDGMAGMAGMGAGHSHALSLIHI